jgi:hypothetical protein
MFPGGARYQERLYWRGLTVIYWTGPVGHLLCKKYRNYTERPTHPLVEEKAPEQKLVIDPDGTWSLVQKDKTSSWTHPAYSPKGTGISFLGA